MIRRLGENYVANCDECGRDLETFTPDYMAATRIMREAGWRTAQDVLRNWRNYCADCA